MKKYIVYAYISPSNKRYIGQTCNPLHVRAANGEGYKACPKFYQAIKKYGWKNFSVSILKDNLTAEEADYWEQFYIKKYSTTDDKFGYNLTYGGQLNHKVSQETKDKMKKSRQGYKHSEETKQKISKAHKGKPKAPEHKKHLSESRKGIKISKDKTHHFTEKEKILKRNNPSVSKKVKCVETGIIYPSAAEAARQLGLTKSNHINDCINNPSRYKTVAGYHWIRIEGEEND